MIYIHNIIKIKYVNEGYLPNYPYHMISDHEMCTAFLNTSSNSFFTDNYPCVSESIKTEYTSLVTAIQYHIDKYLESAHTQSQYEIPDWVYSYMLGTVISVNSDPLDIHDLLVLLGCDNISDTFSDVAATLCYKESNQWLRKRPTFNGDSRYIMYHGKRIDLRPPTMFGEPHVIKSARLRTSNAM